MVVVLWQGVKEHCYFLKQIADAVKMRRAIGNAFERANIPGLTDQQRWVRQGDMAIMTGAGRRLGLAGC